MTNPIVGGVGSAPQLPQSISGLRNPQLARLYSQADEAIQNATNEQNPVANYESAISNLEQALPLSHNNPEILARLVICHDRLAVGQYASSTNSAEHLTSRDHYLASFNNPTAIVSLLDEDMRANIRSIRGSFEIERPATPVTPAPATTTASADMNFPDLLVTGRTPGQRVVGRGVLAALKNTNTPIFPEIGESTETPRTGNLIQGNIGRGLGAGDTEVVRGTDLALNHDASAARAGSVGNTLPGRVTLPPTNPNVAFYDAATQTDPFDLAMDQTIGLTNIPTEEVTIPGRGATLEDIHASVAGVFGLGENLPEGQPAIPPTSDVMNLSVNANAQPGLRAYADLGHVLARIPQGRRDGEVLNSQDARAILADLGRPATTTAGTRGTSAPAPTPQPVRHSPAPQPVININPTEEEITDSGNSEYIIANEQFRRGNYRAALQHFQNSAALLPRSANTQYSIARTCLAALRVRSGNQTIQEQDRPRIEGIARQALSQLSVLDPNRENMAQLRARFAMNQPESSIRWLREVAIPNIINNHGGTLPIARVFVRVENGDVSVVAYNRDNQVITDEVNGPMGEAIRSSITGNNIFLESTIIGEVILPGFASSTPAPAAAPAQTPTPAPTPAPLPGMPWEGARGYRGDLGIPAAVQRPVDPGTAR